MENNPRHFGRNAAVIAGRGLLWLLAPLLALAGPVAVGQLGQIHNADSLVIPALYDDLFVSGYAMDGWKLPGSLYFYPDLLMYAPLRLLGGSTMIAAALFAQLQFGLFLILWRGILRECTGRERHGLVDLLLGPAAALFVLYISFAGRPEAYLDLFRMAHHTGATLASLLSIYLTLRWLRVRSSYLLVLLFLNTGLCALSDRIYVVMGLVPVLVGLAALLGRFRGPVLRVGAIHLAAVVLAEPLRRSLHQTFRIKNFIASAGDGLAGLAGAKKVLKGLQVFASEFAAYFGTAFVLLCALCVISAGVVLWRSLRPSEDASDSNPTPASFAPADSIRFLLSGLFATAPLLIVASIVVGLANYGGAFQPRYLSLLVTAPFFLLVLFVVAMLGSRKIQMTSGSEIAWTWASAALLIVLMMALPGRFGPSKIAQAYQFEHITAECLDKHAKELNLKYGLSDYWAAKTTTLFSRTGLRVNQLDHNLNVFYWVNNFNWYLERDPVYDFLIMDRLNAKAVGKAFGEPARRLQCGPSLVFVYNRPGTDARFRRKLTRDKLLLWRMLTGND